MDFDLIISDEAHRSMREVLEYFVGFKLGLTANRNSKHALRINARRYLNRTI